MTDMILELEPVNPGPAEPAPAPTTAVALAANSPAALMLQAMRQGASLDQVAQMLDLQERFERREAEKAFNEALAAFKGESIEIIKRKRVYFENKSGGITDYKHAELSDVIEAVGPALSRHGFSWGWKTTQANGTIEVTCTLKHRLGHSESATMSAPYDTSGGKNAIQAIVSAKTYLERHTLKAICGVAEKGEDDDGAGSGPTLLEFWTVKLEAARTLTDVQTVGRDGADAFTKARDVPGYRAFVSAVQARRAAIHNEAGHA